MAQNRKIKLYIDDTLGKIVRYCRTMQGPGINKISEMTQHIYISNFDNACDIDQIRELGINIILYLGLKEKESSTLKRYRKRKIEHIQFRIEDSESSNLVPHLDRCYDMVHQYILDEKKILIHCDKGVSLSPSLVAYYFIKRYYLTNFKRKKSKTKELIDFRTSFLPIVFRFMKECRPCIDPKPNFIYQILCIEQQMKQYFYRIIIEEAKSKGKFDKEDDSEDDSDPELMETKKEHTLDTLLSSDSEDSDGSETDIKKKKIKESKKVKKEKDDKKRSKKDKENKKTKKDEKKTNAKKKKKISDYDKLEDLKELEITESDMEAGKEDNSTETKKTPKKEIVKESSESESESDSESSESEQEVLNNEEVLKNKYPIDNIVDLDDISDSD